MPSSPGVFPDTKALIASRSWMEETETSTFVRIDAGRDEKQVQGVNI
jgi:hypothetical protein